MTDAGKLEIVETRTFGEVVLDMVVKASPCVMITVTATTLRAGALSISCYFMNGAMAANF